MLRLERAGVLDADVFRLLGRELGKLDAELGEMQRRHLLVEVLGENIDLLVVLALVGEQLDLRQYLVGEGGAHDEARMTGGAAEIDQPPLGQNDEPLAVWEDDLVDLRLHLFPLVVAQAGDLYLTVEMANVAD